MKNDINSREDIKIVITDFYKKLTEDKFMYPFFAEIVENNTLEIHLELITDFWEDILLQTNKYHDNVMQKHLDFNATIKFEKEHFDLWLNYLIVTIDELHIGNTSEVMKNRARSIAMILQVKMNLYTI